MPDLAESISIFTRARYAAWAGDLTHSRRLLRSITLRSSAETEKERSWDSMGMVLHAASELLSHINEDNENKEHPLPESKSAPPNEMLIVTSHLRGVIHRTGDYEFEVRAYLDDLAWETSLYERCSELSVMYEPNLRERVRKIRRKELKRDTAEMRRPSASWRLVDEELLRTVFLGPFALIKIGATWIGKALPPDFERVRNKLEGILLEIDHGDQVSDELVET
jgi:hypothetical protein